MRCAGWSPLVSDNLRLSEARTGEGERPVNELVPPDPTGVARAAEALRDRTRMLAEGSRAANTLKADAGDMAQFQV